MHKKEEIRTPLIIVYTGNGKGKTTASMGLIMRTLGHGKSCAVLQFIKSDAWETGEKLFALSHGVLWENYGKGFLWEHTDEEPSRKICQDGWKRAMELISSQQFELVVLDEFTYPLQRGYIDCDSVVAFFSSIRELGKAPHIVITGRNIPESIIAEADMVHEIVEIKHPWRNKRLSAQQCIEY